MRSTSPASGWTFRPALLPALLAAVCLVALGALLLVLGLQVHGFVGGMGQGAGAMLVVLGLLLLVRSLRGGPSAQPDTGSWLPSRDGHR